MFNHFEVSRVQVDPSEMDQTDTAQQILINNTDSQPCLQGCLRVLFFQRPIHWGLLISI